MIIATSDDMEATTYPAAAMLLTLVGCFVNDHCVGIFSYVPTGQQVVRQLVTSESSNKRAS